MLKKIYTWMGQKVHSPYAEPFLGFLFFTEAIFFLPVDPILILFCLERPNKSLRYATIATIFSVLGGMTGYLIGFSLWQTAGPKILDSWLVSSIMSPATFASLAHKYEVYSHWAVLVAGFSPIPYKAATLSAGFCKISFLPFVFFSIIARGARFFMFAIAILIWGPQIKLFIDRYFNLLVVLTMALIAGAIWLLK